jgi:AcrR family transcriptional regulator
LTDQTAPAAAPRRARGPYQNGQRTRQQIVAAAMSSIAERGFHGTSLRSIAAAVGISPAALLRHFGSKDELLNAVLRTWAEETDDLQLRLRGLKRWTIQTEIMRYHIEHRGYLEFFITLAAEATSLEHPARAYMAPRYENTIDYFANSLLEAVEDGEIQPLDLDQARAEARAMAAFMDGIEIQWLLDPSIDVVGAVEQQVNHVIERLR